MKEENKKYLKLIASIIISYIGIKIIDNYKGTFENLKILISILSPFFTAFIFAYIFNLIMNFLEKKLKLKKRWQSLLIIYGGMICTFIFTITFMAPIIITNLTEFIIDIPSNVKEIEIFMTNNISKIEILKNTDVINSINENIRSFIPKIGNIVQFIADSLITTLATTVSYTLNIVLAFIISFYVLLEKESFIDVFKKFLKSTIGKKRTLAVLEVGNTLNSTIGTYIVAALIEAFFVAIIAGIGLYVIGAKYAALLGAIVGVTNLIPYFGPFLGMLVTVVINLFYNPIKALWSLIFLLILQQIEGNIIAPNFIGGQVGINPFLTLLAVTVGGGLFGIPGMLLAVPVMAVIKIYVNKFLNKGEKE